MNMKATPTQYAKTLYELTKDKKHQEIDEVVSSFIKELNKNGQLKLAQSIIKKFQEVHNTENGIVEAEVVTRENLGEDVRKHVITYVSNRYGAKEVILHNKVDENMKGGIIVKVGNEVMDGSVGRQLHDLKSTLEK